jgi:ligand-binding sensor domain-containing protein
MRKLITIFIFALVYLTVNTYSADYWKKIDGPYGGYVNSIEFDTQTGDIFIATSNQGAFQQKNGSNKWISLNDNILKYNSTVNKIFVDNSGFLLALTDSLGILKRGTDKVWVPKNTGLNPTVSFKTIVKIKDNVFVAGSLGMAIYRTTNGGDNWSNYNSGLMPEENIYSLCLVKNILFAGTDRGIFKSSDEGKKWLKVNEEIFKTNDIIFDEVNNEVLAATSKGVYRSRDFGINWNFINNGLEGEINVNSITTKGDSIFIGTNDKGILATKSDDINWKRLPEEQEVEYVQVLKSFGSNLFIGSSRAFFRLSDGELSRDVEGINIYNVNAFIENDNILFTATDNGIFQSSNFGYSWSALNKGLQLGAKVTTIIATKQNELIAGTDKGIFHLDKNENRWIKYNNEELNNETINVMVIDSFGTVYTGTASKGVWKTSENRWLQMNGGDIEKQEVLSLIVVDSNYIYAGTSRNGLYRKAPFDEWRPVTISGFGITNVSSLEYVITSPQDEISKARIILAGTNVGVFRSRDNGFIWAKTNGTLSSQVISMATINGDTVFAGLKNVPGIYRTLNSGDSWSNLIDLSGINKYKITNFYNSQSGFIFAGTKEGGCYRSVATYKDLNPQKPILKIIGTKEFCEGEFCVLDAGSDYNQYLWSNGSKSRYDTIWNQGKYWVKVWNEYGLTNISDTITIKVEPKPEKPNVLFNGDILFCPSDAARYVWYLNDKEIIGAKQKIFKPTESGWYKCQIFTSLNCNNVSDAVRVELVGIEDFNTSKINVYPVPTDGILNIKFNNNNEKYNIKILNTLGIELKSLEANESQINLNVNEFPTGIYFINISVGNLNYLTKFIKK